MSQLSPLKCLCLLVLMLHPLALGEPESISTQYQMMDKQVVLLHQRVRNDETKGLLSEKEAKRYHAKLGVIHKELRDAQANNEFTPEVADVLQRSLTSVSQDIGNHERQPIRSHVHDLEKHLPIAP